MTIGLLTSHRGQKQYEKEYRTVIAHFEKRGHKVVHSMETTLESLLNLTYAEREEILMKFYRQLEECDVIFAECSIQSTQLGFGIAQIRAKGKPVVMLYQKDKSPDFHLQGEVYSSIDNMLAYEYNTDNMSRVLDDALNYMNEHIDKRFTMIFPAPLLARLEETSQKRKVPKAVFIRQLIEEQLQQVK